MSPDLLSFCPFDEVVAYSRETACEIPKPDSLYVERVAEVFSRRPQSKNILKLFHSFATAPPHSPQEISAIGNGPLLAYNSPEEFFHSLMRDDIFERILRGAPFCFLATKDALRPQSLQEITYISHLPFDEDFSYEKCLERAVLFRANRLGPHASAYYYARLLNQYWQEPFRPYHALYECFLPARPTVFLPQKSHTRLRLAHIVPQLVDGHHSASKIVKAFFDHADRRSFDLYCYATDALTRRKGQLPLTLLDSQPTSIRGARFLEHLRNIGVTVETEQTFDDLWKTAERVANFCLSHEIDVAIFHEADPINLIAANMLSGFKKAFYMHSGGLHCRGFDLYFCADEAYRTSFSVPNTCVIAADLLCDMRYDWQGGFADLEKPIMCTFTNHIRKRFSPQFCQAVATILRAVPEAHYVVHGIADDELKAAFPSFFPTDVLARVFLKEPLANLSSAARSYTLYLNEFPCGSGLALLAAMAAGLPIVTCHDENGPQNARLGARWFGRFCQEKDYAKLAISLLKDSVLCSEYRRHALARYRELVNPSSQVRAIESELKTVTKFPALM